ncbi:hypothetical protein PG993_008139 [Apiospora rasikravindrae]|uniref:HIT-type domain-containing protein n=1 Tax=Apiospora rasikravindrae TaxID=990691 RepID=A0ABR1SZH6_9PEZI
MAPMIPAERICISCEKEDGKYKCPKCAKYTCSLPCSKAHREIHDNEPQPEPKAGESSSAQADNEPEPEGGHSPLTKLFKKYPNLPHQLRAIADSTDPPKDEAGNRLHFQPNRRGKKQEPWTQEIGLQNGMTALRRGLSSAPRGSADSEGLREYCELFKHQLAEKAERGEDPDAEFRRRTAQHDAEVIRKLMEEEKKQGKD